jgi:hypothetical protein
MLWRQSVRDGNASIDQIITGQPIFQSYLTLPDLETSEIIEETVGNWREPGRLFHWHNSYICLIDKAELLADTCGGFVTYFKYARGRRVFSLSLDSEHIECMCDADFNQGTDKGKPTVLGFGPFTAHKGDQVWVLQGSEIPYVLRPIYKGEGNDPGKHQQVMGMPYQGKQSSRGSVQSQDMKDHVPIYQLQGEAWLYGAISGELLECRQEEFPLEELILR